MNQGIIFAFLTALISGFSIFVNKFAVSSFPNPLLFTTLKNLTVGILIFFISHLRIGRPFDHEAGKKEADPRRETLSLCAGRGFILGIGSFERVKKLSGKDLAKMTTLGIVGGSIPFLLFFAGLKIGSAGMAAFIHKTLFIWVSILAIIFLKEKFSFWQILSFLMLFTGVLYLGGPKALSFGRGELLAFIATLFWSFETILVKKFLPKIDYKTAALGRMLLGGIIMSLFLILTGKLTNLSLSLEQLKWLLITSVFLLGYVLSWYKALKHAPAYIASSILTFGFVITSALQTGFLAHKIISNQIIGQLTIVFGIALLMYGYFVKKIFT